MDNLGNEMAKIQMAHAARSNRVELQITIKGQSVLIIGKIANIMDLAITEVELLTSESLPGKFHLQPHAAANFEKAAEQLVEEGKPFYTTLRGNWALPALKWEMAP